MILKKDLSTTVCLKLYALPTINKIVSNWIMVLIF